VGTADELVKRVRALEQDGLRELIFETGTGAKWRLAEEFRAPGHGALVNTWNRAAR
jgi:hypothetical protein